MVLSLYDMELKSYYIIATYSCVDVVDNVNTP